MSSIDASDKESLLTNISGAADASSQPIKTIVSAQAPFVKDNTLHIESLMFSNFVIASW